MLFMQAATNLFDYNQHSELVSALMDTNDYQYLYDPIGNREKVSLNAVTNFYTANELNQYTNIANGVTNQPTYDADGNMLTCGDWTYTWNGENRLIVASNGTTVVNNTYDYMGRRFRKVVNGVTNTFLYDGWAMIRDTSPTVTNSYIYGLDLSGTPQGAGTIGGILSAVLNGTDVFYCFDANGNVTDLVDTNGSSVAHYEYGPFGQKTAESGTLSTSNPFQFSTKYLDAELGLYYYGCRCYSPEMGRWMSRDPIGEEGGHNLYSFVLNTPITLFDFLGLMEFDWQLQLTRHTSSYLGYTDALSSALNCSCTPCNMECTLNVIIFINVAPGLENMPPPLDYDSTLAHEVKHAKAFMGFFEGFESRIAEYEDAYYSTPVDCDTGICEITHDFDSELRSFNSWQAAFGPCEGHPCGWDSYAPSSPDALNAINTL
ncbi:MAG: RHS repeat-associated core domain-containing protein [Verrucomicrobiae bacterium]|nr:RHS repeat-associated core domain-containing protein [Verrucomicrobiae bacterium]